ncbi:uncharacterized protein LOC110854475 [Folsomia candida]|uniref:non-specific serine/threonine protein kinase n=1 Tax=Folsomia candida TaxID=158441 RepID=A0A226DWF7_FOLCA|nr:uncharacterized protein LOC110854475 [Folsomia candida]OXA49549.1 Serine/threonine-protein kinase PDIK1L [Folsomia candida]
MEAAPDFLDTVTSYESFLGRGAFGFVLKAKHKDGTYSCIKFIYPTDNDKLKRQTERETSLTRKLEDYRHIVTVKNSVCKKYLNPVQLEGIFSPCKKIVEAGWQDTPEKIKQLGWTCIQMELCGENLDSWLRDPETTMTSIFIQAKQVEIILHLFYGLKFLHEKQIIHRDLKPANVMFASDKYKLPVKIGDFGQSRTAHGHNDPTLTSSGIGTPAYRAPEVKTGTYSYQSDIFSLGLIIWEVVALIKPEQKHSLFDRLVNDGETELVKEDHPLIGSLAKELVINSTRKNLEQRHHALGNVGKIIEKLVQVQTQEKVLTCRNGEDLELCLPYVTPGSTIILGEGTYQGQFNLRGDGISIIGKGVDKTQILSSPAFHIFGQDCLISNLSLLVPTSSTDGYSGFAIHGTRCRLTKINVINANYGIHMHASDIKIDTVKFINNYKWCITMTDTTRSCTISDVTCENIQDGIHVDGTNHHLQKIRVSFSPNKRYNALYGIYFEGDNHTLEDFTCTGNTNNSRWDLYILSSSTTVKNSTCYNVLVDGDGARLNNVESRNLIGINGDLQNVQLVKCKSKNLEASGAVTMTGCTFDSVNKPSK